MANTQKYLNHLLQNTGITPACSEEERAAADIVADIFRDHGFQPEIQEFSASSSEKVAQAAMGIMVFVGAVLMGIGGAVGIVGVIIALAGAVLFVMERSGHPVLSNMGAGGLSQNVIAYHKASGPLASPRNRPVVVVAHYDSPRADLLSQEPYASYRPMLVKLLPFAMIAPAILAVVRLLPVPAPAKIVLWILAIIVALVPLANAVAIIANKFVLPYTSGSVCNKSSVAAMLGVMDAVSPYQGVNEFPGDVPFDQYMEEQRSYAPVMELVDQDAVDADFEDEYGAAAPADEQVEEQDEASAVDASTPSVAAYDEDEESSDAAATAMWSALDAETMVAAGVEAARRANQAAAAVQPVSQPVADPGSTVAMTSEQFAAALLNTDVQVEGSAQAASADKTVAFEVAPEAQSAAPEVSAEPEGPALPINASGNIRYGVEVLRALGMVSSACAIEYEAGASAVPPVKPEPQPVVQPAVQPAVPAAVQPVLQPVESSARQVEDVPAPVAGYHEVAPTPVDGDGVPASHNPASEYEDDEAYTPLTDESYESQTVESAAYEEAPIEEDLEPQRVDQTSMWAVPAEFGGSSAYAEDEATGQQDDEDSFDGYEDESDQSMHSAYLDYADDADDYILEAEYEIIDDGMYDEIDESVEDVAAEEASEEVLQDDEIVDDDEAASDIDEVIDAVDDADASDFDIDDEDADTEGASEEEPAEEAEACDGDEVEGENSFNGEGVVSESELVDMEEEVAESVSIDAVEEGDSADESSVGSDGDAESVEPSDSTVDGQSEAQPVEQPMVDVTADTQLFQMPQNVMKPGATQAMPMPTATKHTMPRRPVETVDSLMAQIAQPQPAVHVPPRSINVPDISVPANARRIPAVPGIEAFQQQNASQNRSPLFDLPDPSVKPADPFASASPSTTSAASRGFSVVSSAPQPTPAPAPVQEQQVFETIKAPAPQPKKQRRGLGGLFGRKKKQQESMSEWLGVDDDFDAKRSGGEIGSWDNFDGDDNGWKGGATGVDGVTELELRDAITSMGDDELLGHDIWFVATGASECGNAGLKAFLETHRDKLRGVFLINLESVGAGQVAMLASEGDSRALKGDKRIMKLVQQVSSDFHHEIGAVDMPYVNTDAHAAMNMSLRSLTIAGIEGAHFACSHSEEDMPYNVNDENINKVADVVTEVIRRS